MNLNMQTENNNSSSRVEFPKNFVGEEIDEAFSYPRPTLYEVLREIGPLREEEVFLGVADDGLPVLLDLWDPRPGPILVLGNSHSGKTSLLKVLTRFIVTTHRPCDTQYGVITNRPHEWDNDANYPHSIGIFSATQKNTFYFIQALTIWIEKNKSSRQSILLLIDGFDEFPDWNGLLAQNLKKILLYGPARKVLPIVTINSKRVQSAGAWLEYFHTRLYGYTDDVKGDGCSYVRYENLPREMEFVFREDSQWIKFWVPKIDL